MTETARLVWLIHYLQQEMAPKQPQPLPTDFTALQRLFRGLCNIRAPKPIDSHFLALQDAYLQAQLAQKQIATLADAKAYTPQLYLWQGDLTAFQADAIVNPANESLLGCFIPNHNCLDNLIHSAAGVQLRLRCQTLMQAQGHAEPAGQVKCTAGYNLPAKYVLHTVGPATNGVVTDLNKAQLQACYRAILTAAQFQEMRTVAIPCISTGVFRYPHEAAAQVAVTTVQAYLKTHPLPVKVIFNVYQDRDRQAYEKVLAGLAN